MKNEITKAMLHRFFVGNGTDQETDMIKAWIDENPEEHRKILDKEYKQYTFNLMFLDAPEANVPQTYQEYATLMSRVEYQRMSDSETQKRIKLFNRPKFLRWTAGIAASLLIMAGAGFAIRQQTHNTLARQTTTIEAPAGQHIRFKLNDGSVIDLNSGGSITYPAVFAKGERRVKLAGEAMFNVAHDAKKPFVVETFACEVRVLGTQFNVIADEDDNEFSTALLEGSVTVNHRSNNEEIVLEPNMTVHLLGGHLVASRIESMDDYLWPEGIISVGGLPFEALVEKLENAYNVRIILANRTYPVIKYAKLQLRVSDGIDYAMKVLSRASDFQYEYDTSENTVIIK